MKLLINIARIVVGLLFIFSGLVKANDPLGLSYKMQEFFDLWGLSQFNSWTEWLSIFIIAFEIVAGAALLLGWKMKLFSWLLLLLIIFFTFLTAYAYFSGKFKNCGCFGDCIPITPLQSFIKDLVLLLLIIFLFINRKMIRPVFNSKLTAGLMAIITILSFGIQWYMLNYLPVFDCLAYKKGKNITQQMKIPADAVPDSVVITFVYEKDGKQIEFTANKFPADFDSSYKFISRYDKVVKKGKNNEPPVKGFVLSGITDEDSTAIVLSQPYAVLLFCESFSTPVSVWQEDFAKLYAIAKEKNIPVYAITSQLTKARAEFKNTSFADIQVFKCDNTAIRTAARTNPTVYLLKEGTISNKWSYRRMNRATKELTSLVVQPAIKQENELSPDTTLAPVNNNKIK